MMVLTTGRIKRHRYSFATFAAIRRASSRVSSFSCNATGITTLPGER